MDLLTKIHFLRRRPKAMVQNYIWRHTGRQSLRRPLSDYHSRIWHRKFRKLRKKLEKETERRYPGDGKDLDYQLDVLLRLARNEEYPRRYRQARYREVAKDSKNEASL